MQEPNPKFQPEPTSAPAQKRKVVIIKDHSLCYTGENFNEFLDCFELIAEVYGAEGYNMVRQVFRFVQGEDIRQELESMDGYAERDWNTLRRSMIETWGEVYSRIKHTVQDLKDLAEEYSKKGGLKTMNEFKAYHSKFHLISKYLIRNEHINSKRDVGFIFLSAFSKETQKNIKRELVKGKRITYGKDGYPKPPEFEDLTEIAENEIRAEFEETFTTQSFSESNKKMQKNLEDKRGPRGKQRERMIE